VNGKREWRGEIGRKLECTSFDIQLRPEYSVIVIRVHQSLPRSPKSATDAFCFPHSSVVPYPTFSFPSSSTRTQSRMLSFFVLAPYKNSTKRSLY